MDHKGETKGPEMFIKLIFFISLIGNEGVEGPKGFEGPRGEPGMIGLQGDKGSILIINWVI